MSHETIGQAATAAALVDAIVKIVPMEHVNGRTKVEGGEWCERKNGRGVDTNRNWAVDWGVKEADFDPYEEYPGNKPFSEPEARMLRSLVEEFKPHAWVNVHSGMEAMFMPYDHKASEPKGEGAQAMRSILRDLNRFHCGGRCATGGGGKGVGYRARHRHGLGVREGRGAGGVHVGDLRRHERALHGLLPDVQPNREGQTRRGGSAIGSPRACPCCPCSRVTRTCPPTCRQGAEGSAAREEERRERERHRRAG